MRRYIDAESLMKQVVKKKPEVAKVRYTEGFNDAIMRVRSMIHSAPTADVVEVRHGEWLPAGTFEDFAKCSVCGLIDHSLNEVYSRGTYNYCPNCGAKMDGERREE